MTACSQCTVQIFVHLTIKNVDLVYTYTIYCCEIIEQKKKNFSVLL